MSTVQPDVDTKAQPAITGRWPERLIRCIVGLAMFGLGIRCFVAGDLGLAPWDILHEGLAKRTGLGIGWWIEIIGVVIVVVSWFALHQRPGIGTILNAIEIGLVVTLIGDHLPTSDLLVWRGTYVAAGVVSIAIGSGLYIGAGLGAGPRDGLMLGLASRGMSVRLGRTIIEATVMVLGVAIGGSIGIGTAVFVVAIGPCVQFFMPRLAMRSNAPVTGSDQ